MTDKKQKVIKVLGCGNTLVGDDGVGIRVIEKLQEMKLPENVEIIEAGVGGMAILSWIEDADKIDYHRCRADGQ